MNMSLLLEMSIFHVVIYVNVNLFNAHKTIESLYNMENSELSMEKTEARLMP